MVVLREPACLQCPNCTRVALVIQAVIKICLSACAVLYTGDTHSHINFAVVEMNSVRPSQKNARVPTKQNKDQSF